MVLLIFVQFALPSRLGKLKPWAASASLPGFSKRKRRFHHSFFKGQEFLFELQSLVKFTGALVVRPARRAATIFVQPPAQSFHIPQSGHGPRFGRDGSPSLPDRRQRHSCNEPCRARQRKSLRPGALHSREACAAIGHKMHPLCSAVSAFSLSTYQDHCLNRFHAMK